MTTTDQLVQALEPAIGVLESVHLDLVLQGRSASLQLVRAIQDGRRAIATWEAEKANQPLIIETAEEARKDREQAEAYYRKAEKLLTYSEATLHERIKQLEAEKASEQQAQLILKPIGDVVVLRRKRDGGVSRLSRIMDRSKDLESCLLHWRDIYTNELWNIEVCQIFSKSKAPAATKDQAP